MVSLAPICSWPRPRLPESKSWVSPRRIKLIAGSMCLSRTFPAGVSCTRLVLRINSGCSNFFSRVLMDWLTADWEIYSCLLASEKLREVAT